MIKPDAKLSIQRISLDCLQVKEHKPRYTSMVLLYVQQLRDNPHDDAGLFRVTPSATHPGLFVILDGHHKLCAHIIAGRSSALCIVVEESE